MTNDSNRDESYPHEWHSDEVYGHVESPYFYVENFDDDREQGSVSVDPFNGEIGVGTTLYVDDSNADDGRELSVGASVYLTLEQARELIASLQRAVELVEN